MGKIKDKASSEVSTRFVKTVETMKLNSMIRSQKSFAEKCGYGEQTVTAIKNGSQLAPLAFISMAKQLHPTINLDYLFTGVGEMFLSAEEFLKPGKSQINKDELINILTDTAKSLKSENEKYIEALAKMYDYLKGEGFDIEKLKSFGGI